MDKDNRFVNIYGNQNIFKRNNSRDTIVKSNLSVILFITILILIGCDNREQIEDSKKESLAETQNIEKLKDEYERSIDSLNKEIDAISQNKSNLEKENNFAEAQIYSILKESHFDHLIIGTTNISDSRNFFSDVLGFNIKNGRQHVNGINNLFIEFEDDSEIELLTVNDPKDKIARKYKSLIEQNKFGMQFAMRTSRLNEITSHFANLNSVYNTIHENEIYSVLSKNKYDERLPLFLIEHKNKNFNTETDHQNSAKGIRSIWFSTQNLKNSIFDLADLGYQLIDTTKIFGFSNKSVIMRNENFEIILIEDKDYKISGVTIIIDDLSLVKRRLDDKSLKYRLYRDEEGNSLLLSPETTKSIWIEFKEL